MDDLRERIEKRLAELRQMKEHLTRQLIAVDAVMGELKTLLEDDSAEDDGG